MSDDKSLDASNRLRDELRIIRKGIEDTLEHNGYDRQNADEQALVCLSLNVLDSIRRRRLVPDEAWGDSKRILDRMHAAEVITAYAANPRHPAWKAALDEHFPLPSNDRPDVVT